MLGCVFTAMAQSYYDDDIYYDPSKDTKTKQVNAAVQKARQQRQQQEAARQKALQQQAYQQVYQQYYGNYDPTLGGEDFAAADTYKPTAGGSARDVDEYNRQGRSARRDSLSGQMAQPDEFAYTQRIEKFHNPDIISSVNDPDLVDYYYSSAASQPNINI